MKSLPVSAGCTWAYSVCRVHISGTFYYRCCSPHYAQTCFLSMLYCILFDRAGVPLIGLTDKSQVTSLIHYVGAHIVISDDGASPCDVMFNMSLSHQISHCPVYAVDSTSVCPLRDLQWPVYTAPEPGQSAHSDVLLGPYTADSTFQAFKTAVDVSPWNTLEF